MAAGWRHVGYLKLGEVATDADVSVVRYQVRDGVVVAKLVKGD